MEAEKEFPSGSVSQNFKVTGIRYNEKKKSKQE